MRDRCKKSDVPDVVAKTKVAVRAPLAGNGARLV
jgi:hypothetical protein